MNECVCRFYQYIYIIHNITCTYRYRHCLRIWTKYTKHFHMFDFRHFGMSPPQYEHKYDRKDCQFNESARSQEEFYRFVVLSNKCVVYVDGLIRENKVRVRPERMWGSADVTGSHKLNKNKIYLCALFFLSVFVSSSFLCSYGRLWLYCHIRLSIASPPPCTHTHTHTSDAIEFFLLHLVSPLCLLFGYSCVFMIWLVAF